MTKRKQDQRPVYKGALNELNAVRMQICQVNVIMKEAMQNLDRLHDLLQVQLDRAEGKKPPKNYQLGVDPNSGHVFGPPRPARQGMNHTAEQYRVCIKCGRSDVNLRSEGMPLCQSQK